MGHAIPVTFSVSHTHCHVWDRSLASFTRGTTRERDLLGGGQGRETSQPVDRAASMGQVTSEGLLGIFLFSYPRNQTELLWGQWLHWRPLPQPPRAKKSPAPLQRRALRAVTHQGNQGAKLQPKQQQWDRRRIKGCRVPL